MHTLSIDIETFSAANLPTVGLYKYVECDQFEILLFAYSVDYGSVQVIDLASGERLPEHILFALTDGRVLKTAFNAAFERLCIQKHFGISLPVKQWECTMIKAAMCGLPMSLKAVGAALNLPVQKDSSGAALIKFFSMVCRPTSRNGMRRRNYPLHDFVKWQEFKSYCIRDVEAENAIRKKLEFFQMPETEKRLYNLDQKINDTGIALDTTLVDNAMEIYRSFSESLMAEATEITGLENPNSDAQIKQWIADTDGYETASLNKAVMTEVRDAIDNDTVHRVLDIREQLSKSSIKKYEAMAACKTVDNRAHGLLQFYGANRTGRWSGRLIQIQNLPRINERSIALARQVVMGGDGGLLHLLYGNVPDILSQLIRTAFVPSPGCRFIVADFSAIEARVIAWLAGERWRLEVFATHGKIYEASAAQMFGVPVESIGKDSPLRQKGKVAELACIAEGQMVLTQTGLVPIEKITTLHRLWDGENWVQHDGLIFKGYKKVITYGGLTATEDHEVWTEGQPWPVQFGFAAACGARLLQTGNGRHTIRLGENYQPGETLEEGLAGADGLNKMRAMQSCSMERSIQSRKRLIKRLSKLFAAKANTDLAGQEINGGETKVRKPKRPRICELWGAWDLFQLQVHKGSGSLDNCQSGFTRQKFGDRPDQQQRGLRAGEPEICIAHPEQPKQTDNSFTPMGTGQVALCQNGGIAEAESGFYQRTNNYRSGKSGVGEAQKLEKHSRKTKVYDILNAGPRHRFTVSNVLVHNCGFGGGVGALKAMGALNNGLTEDDLASIISRWRGANKAVVKLWSDMESAAINALDNPGAEVKTGRIAFRMVNGYLCITLPSGRALYYADAALKPNRFGRMAISYSGMNQTTKKWERTDTYGGKIVENCVQGIARDLLAEALLRLDDARYRIVAHIHDEVILDVPEDLGSLEEVINLITINPDWASGLPLAADGFEAKFYQK